MNIKSATDYEYLSILKDISIFTKRYNFYGKCAKCKQSYTSSTWCQRCGPQDATKGWTSETKNIDEYIKKCQLNVTEYEKMVEWIQYGRLINLQKVKEDELEIIFIAT
ncbi:hypothetical protein C2G38_2187987 [Gigaspora rosea]|uniref:Uncharacterized protein n=1 Tax=Gigaspora rosea TaxID=44941 RepID=A0A397V5I4_9GLOM|nr:hypothetical protein C2G38_2187987 [Gigaspora rosea]